jgi:hypothetical protein
MANLEGILTAAGANWSNVVKTTVFLSDLANFGAMNQVYARYFPQKPPRLGPVWRCPSSQRCPSGNRMYCRFSLKIKVGIAHPSLNLSLDHQSF